MEGADGELDGTEPVAEDEILYRRIPANQNWYSRGTNPALSPNAFQPHSKNDEEGLSLTRAKYHADISFAVGNGKSPDGYYIASMRAQDLANAGIDVIPDPQPFDKGHVLIPSMNTTNRKSPETQTKMVNLATRICFDVDGPFPTLEQT